MSTLKSVGYAVRRHQTALSVLVLGLLAYVPSLTASPGRMPADSKLYVYLNPGRFLGDATTTFDPRQFAGWVPHQHIAYLWPTGPWYWLFETIGVPDWVAHRLWIGTLLLAAGLGMRWMTRVLGFAPLAALVAALVYQLSPYILPYISRTSVLLLPFAGLGWIVGLTVLASLRGRWRYPAAIALVVLTVGAVNATALAMVIPAPVIWLVHAAWGGTISWHRAVVTAAKTAVLCLGVSLWWIAMLVIQGRYGADVLAYSESLESVSFTSTSTEVTRGLGYWLFYVRDAYAATTTASLDHLVSGRTIAAGYAVIAVGLAGLVCFRWPHRRFAALLFGAGVILGVGVHPIDDSSPVMSLLVGDGEGGLALALRSSTRAVPVMLLGLALGTAAFVTRIGSVRLPRRAGAAAGGNTSTIPARAIRVGAAAAIGACAVIALPALRSGGFIDEALERDQDPPDSWLAAAAELDDRPEGHRVLQLPGTEFGAFQWGYTVDQPLPALTERALVTRDLLPLGSPAAMDLVFALDDRVQTDTIEPAAVAAVSRMLGVDTIWVSGDVSYDRFQLARPEVVTDELSSPAALDAGLVGATSFGEPTVMASQIPMIDNRSLGDPRIGEPIAPVTLIDVADPVPTVRVKDDVVILAGSGDGIIDAAAAGVIDGTEAVIYDATLDASSDGLPPDLADQPFRYVITDSNRDRAHHWRSSQDVTGFTETDDDASDVLRFESGDQRLPVFDDASSESDSPDSDRQTVSVQVGPVTAEASGYGETFAYLPEVRPAMAIDGDPSTAWIVADRGAARGEFIELTLEAGQSADHIDLLQPPAGPGERTITDVVIEVDGGAPTAFPLDESSRTGTGQRVPVDEATETIRITIARTTTPQPPIGEAIGGVGFAEIDLGLGPTTEFIRTPIDVLGLTADADGTDIVLTRLRTEPADRWRNDPEPALRREVELSAPLGEVGVDVTLRLDRRAGDAALAELLDEPVVASDHLVGVPTARGAAAFDGDEATAWITPFDRGVGERVTLLDSGSATEMTIVQPSGDHSPITGITVTDGAGTIDLDLPGAPASGDRVETTLRLPRPVDLSEITVEITSVDARFVQNRRFNEPTQLPTAIAEIRFDGRSPAVTSAETLSADCADELLSIDGERIPLSFDIATADALDGRPIPASTCSDSVELDSGSHTVVSEPARTTGFDVDRVVLSTTSTEPTPAASAVDPTETVLVESSDRTRTLDVPPCPDGCWVILGEGFNSAWNATADGEELAGPVLIDGNANGWWLPPTTGTTRVDIEWPVQRTLNIAFALSALAAAACFLLIVVDRRRSRDAVLLPVGPAARASVTPSLRALVVSAAVTVAGAALFIDWVWAVPAAIVWSAAIALRRGWAQRIVGVVGAMIILFGGVVVTVVVRREAPFPDAGWPLRFEWLHGWTLLGVILVVGAALAGDGRRTEETHADEESAVHSGAT
ncbi:alpha-(1-_3)-arabinofuranosyltransferase domain-containing protein [Ilumatobacter nonamiensis]|uniref:alpha-(1->3)-arabinofuranosyltransferase domain-containing protein n=1 Tax=Ilumatobacter nonamiensis TaxID=467093 RepID=UPI00034D7A03|nr:alpha-(1->3)-arabinofuranosyltransferase family protein [Ilumatobacter nonamiensis]